MNIWNNLWFRSKFENEVLVCALAVECVHVCLSGIRKESGLVVVIDHSIGIQFN